MSERRLDGSGHRHLRYVRNFLCSLCVPFSAREDIEEKISWLDIERNSREDALRMINSYLDRKYDGERYAHILKREARHHIKIKYSNSDNK